MFHLLMTQKETTANAIKVARENVEVKTFLAPALTGVVPVGMVPLKQIKQEQLDKTAALASSMVLKPVMATNAAVAAVVGQVTSVSIKEGPREMR